MKSLIAILLSINIFACKCNDASLKQSFERADFVFIGNIYDISKTPSGYKTLDDFLSIAKIEKIYKGNSYDGFYTEAVTLFGSQLRSCDLIFDEKGRYLIFAYYEPDTGFLYSTQCLNTKKLVNYSKNDLKILDDLSNSYIKKLKIENLKPSENNIELIVDDLFNRPNRKKNDLNEEVEKLETQIKTQKLVVVILSMAVFILLSTIMWQVLKKKNLKAS